MCQEIQLIQGIIFQAAVSHLPICQGDVQSIAGLFMAEKLLKAD